MNVTQQQRVFPHTGSHTWITVNKDGDVLGGGYDKCVAANVYVYSSSPNPLPVHGRPEYRNNESRPTGASSYYNMMWDGRICRGSAGTCKSQKSFIEYFNVRKPRSIPRKQVQPFSPRLCQPPPSRRSIRERPSTRYDGEPQTNLEELPGPTDAEWQVEDVADLLEMPCCPSLPPADQRMEAETQVYPSEILDQSYRITPLCEEIVGKVTAQARLELMEEEELACLRDQEKMYKAKLKEEEELLERMRAEWVASHKPPTPEPEPEFELVEEPWLMMMAKQIQSEFNPWLNQLCDQEVGYRNVSRQLLDDVIRAVVHQRHKEYFFGLMYEEKDDHSVQRVLQDGE